jgi:hypothetical protein
MMYVARIHCSVREIADRESEFGHPESASAQHGVEPLLNVALSGIEIKFPIAAPIRSARPLGLPLL